MMIIDYLLIHSVLIMKGVSSPIKMHLFQTAGSFDVPISSSSWFLALKSAGITHPSLFYHIGLISHPIQLGPWRFLCWSGNDQTPSACSNEGCSWDFCFHSKSLSFRYFLEQPSALSLPLSFPIHIELFFYFNLLRNHSF